MLPASGAHMRWFRASFELPPPQLPSYGVDLRGISPNAAIYVNGAFVAAGEGFDDRRTSAWNYPLFFAIPSALLHPGVNELLIEIDGATSRTVRVGAAFVGPEESVYPRYQRQLWLQVIGVEVVSTLVGVIGLFAALLWWRRRTDPIFGLFAVSCAIWIVRNCQFFVLHPYVSFFTLSVITDVALFWLLAVLFTLSFRIVNRRFPRLERGLFGFALLLTVATAVAGKDYEFAVTGVAYALFVPMGIALLVFLFLRARSEGTTLNRLLLLAAVVTGATGVYDLLLMEEWLPVPGAFLMPYSALFYAVTVGWALIDQFVRAHNDIEQLNSELEARVHAKERELAIRYAQMTRLERESAIFAERDRILRDMHDGLGLQLISSIRLVERGDLTREQTAELLAQAMDEMRIAIDSVKPTASDLLVMLGNLRYRLEPRLKAAGISLRWSVADATGLEHLLPSQVSEITRIVQEAFANAMKHSAATEMTLSIESLDAGTIQIVVRDNGRGFDTRKVDHGEGFASMRKRAIKIGATLEVDSRVGETSVTVNMPPQNASA